MINFQGVGENIAMRVKAHCAPPGLGTLQLAHPALLCVLHLMVVQGGVKVVFSILLLPHSCWRPVTLWWMWAESMIPLCIAMTTTRGVCVCKCGHVCRGAHVHTSTCFCISPKHAYAEPDTAHTTHNTHTV